MFFESPHDKIPSLDDPAYTGRAAIGTRSNLFENLFGTYQPDSICTIERDVDCLYASTIPTTVHTISIQPGGRLRFLENRDNLAPLSLVNLWVHPGGTLEIGTPAVPVTGSVQIEFRDVPLGPDKDPFQYGNSLLAAGTVTIYGQPKTSWAHAAQPIRAGDTFINLTAPPINWQPGDVLRIPDIKSVAQGTLLAAFPYTEETAIVQSVAGVQVILTAPLARNHQWTAADGTVLETPVANLSRSVELRSENPTGTRGHCLFLDRGTYDIEYAEFVDLGRTTIAPIDNTTTDASGNVTHVGTNQIGRYPIHLHHVYGPENPTEIPVFEVRGNAVYNTVPRPAKWGIAVHDSHYGYVQDNVMNWIAGAGIVTEAGNETENLVSGNLVMNATGWPGPDPWNSDFSDTEAVHGSGFWFRGANNIVNDNVAVNCRRAGFIFYAKDLKPDDIPLLPGADMNDPAQVRLADLIKLPPLSFALNEAIGGLNGFNVYGQHAPVFSLEKCESWIPARAGAATFYAIGSKPTLQDCWLYGDDLLQGQSIGVMHDRYSGWQINGGSIVGFDVGLAAVGWQSIKVDGTKFQCGIDVQLTYAAPANGNASQVTLLNVLFARLRNLPEKWISLRLVSKIPDIFKPNILAWEAKRVNFLEQAGDWIIPAWATAAPQTGITNAESWAQHQVAMGGGVVPAGAITRPEVTGFIL